MAPETSAAPDAPAPARKARRKPVADTGAGANAASREPVQTIAPEVQAQVSGQVGDASALPPAAADPASSVFRQADAGDAGASAQAQASDDAAGLGVNRSRGRKLRTPFRRRRGDAQNAPQGGIAEGAQAEPDQQASFAADRQEPAYRDPAGRRRGRQGQDAQAADNRTAAGGEAGRHRGRNRRRHENGESEQETELALSYLDNAAHMSQRLNKYLGSDLLMPKLHKVLADAGIGSRREMEELIIAGRVSVNGEPAHIGQRVGANDLVRVNGKPVARPNAKKPPRIILYHKPAGEIVSHDDPAGRATVFARLPKVRMGKWLSVGRLDLNTEGLLILTTSGDLANRLMHPRYGAEREYAVRVLGELTDEQKARLTDGVQLEDGPARFGTLDYIGGEGSNRWYRVTLKEGRNREVRRMFEQAGVTVSRLIRTRFGEVVLPRTLRRGRWEELDSSLVTALMLQLGLLRGDDDDSDGGRGRRERQPLSYDSALPPGFGTIERNGMNGAKISRRGKLSGGRGVGAAVHDAFPSDPYGTGLMFSGGLPNGHPNGGAPSGKGKSKGRKARGKPGGAEQRRRGPGARSASNPGGGQSGAAAQGGGTEKGRKGGKRRTGRTGTATRGDDWQPRGAFAHESHLGKLGGGRGR
ncbi:rRNA pseudouridine synthase [Allopusillimonas soli]|uniref:Pseudouridine synthase n=1 Tax=Allopusillimonas soli TaxID=659016 RepID=A0A853FC78_9BURK|nr:rRNA pseudouridine synthase [Allopusillimonas soli]TEA72236.1 rRNA pseudouridine synthase [Allopusillimonas soli]